MLSKVTIYNYKFINIDKNIQANHKYISRKLNALYIDNMSVVDALEATPDNTIVICVNNFVYFNAEDVTNYLSIKYGH